MRYKDSQKQEAIIRATVELVNEIGFVSASISKIARKAGVSPATIYIYYKNKEDLLVSTYEHIKEEMAEILVSRIDMSHPLRDIFRQVWRGMFKYVSSHGDFFHFAEQFASSPFSELVNKEKVERAFFPLTQVMQKGIEQKIIKDVSPELLSAFLYYPIFSLSNKRICKNFELSDENIERAFSMAWDAIKL